MNFYNDNDAYCCQWLRNLIDAEEIPQGNVEERSILDVQTKDLKGFDQCHFFAGVGGWSEALRIAGWQQNRQVFTGSCPCQPYSCAGQQKCEEDARDLWPAFFRLIRECRPDTIFGEQVAGAIGHGWLDRIQRNLEGEGYAVGHCVLGAHSVGAPHIRQRLYWVADRQLGDADGTRQRTRRGPVGCVSGCAGQPMPATGGEIGGLVNAACGGTQPTKQPRRLSGTEQACDWGKYNLVYCRDGKTRRVGAELQPLAYGLPRSVGPGSTRDQRMELVAAKANRVGRLRGYGNAIVPQVAAEFVRAFLESM